MTSTPASPGTPDFSAIKHRQRAAWSAGDFSMVAARIALSAELLAESADLQAGWRVLDVATGSGNAAIAAARRGCQVTGLDYVPALLQRGRTRAAAEQLEVDFVEGDAEQLPFAGASFDAVLSIFGCMFTPDHRRAAAELARVCRAGGRIALACWTPDGFVGQMFKLVSARAPAGPGLTPPARWGERDYLASLFGPAVSDLRTAVRQAVFRFRSADDYIGFFRTYFGPTIKAFEAIEPAAQAELIRELTSTIHRFDRNRGAGPVAIAADYLEAVMTRA